MNCWYLSESRKRKEKKWTGTEDDYYDSDEDTFLDRTGSVERKREGRLQKGDSGKALTYNELVSVPFSPASAREEVPVLRMVEES